MVANVQYEISGVRWSLDIRLRSVAINESMCLLQMVPDTICNTQSLFNLIESNTSRAMSGRRV